LSTNDALYEMRMSIEIGRITLTPFMKIMSLSEAQKQLEIYYHDDFKVSLFIPAPDCCFKHFSLNS
jgi:hypothetical protein